MTSDLWHAQRTSGERANRAGLHPALEVRGAKALYPPYRQRGRGSPAPSHALTHPHTRWQHSLFVCTELVELRRRLPRRRPPWRGGRVPCVYV
jgi:hypothetical protein